MPLQRKRSPAFLLALLLAFSLLALPAQAASITVDGYTFQDGMGQKADVKGAKAAILHTVQNRSPFVDLTRYGLGSDQLEAVFDQVFFENPSLFYLENGFSYQLRQSRGNPGVVVVGKVEPSYYKELSEGDRETYEAAVSRALAVLRPGMTDFDKALALHDWLAAHCAYDDSLTRYSPYHALVTGSAVCRGYLLAYSDLLGRAGVENAPAISESQNHGWNTVKLDGVWYHVDVTWDHADGLPSGWVLHTNFLRSDSGIRATGDYHQDWKTQALCADSRYEDSFLPYLRTPVLYPPEGGAYFLLDGRLYLSADLSSLHYKAVSHAGGGTTVHPTAGTIFSPENASLAYFDGNIYYTDAYSIYRYELTSGQTYRYATYQGGKGFLYGLSLTGEGTEARLIAEVRTYPPGKVLETLRIPPVLSADSVHLQVCPARNFTDVNRRQWYHEAVDYVLEQGLMNGVSGTRFDPGGQTTRAMAVTMLYRMAGSPKAGPARFNDVVSGSWYADAVNWAVEAGVVTGITAETFRPEDPVTRQQLAAILYRYARAAGKDSETLADLSAFWDAGQIDGYARTPLAWAAGAGLITGRDGSLLAPRDNATRAETAAILMRLNAAAA